MSDNFGNLPEHLTATVELSVSGQNLRLEMSVPTGPTRPARMLPLFRSLAETLVGLAVENARAEGLEVSCRKGCGACCRQMVPVSKFEARRLRELVNEMPEPRRSEVVSRFEAARCRMREAGLMEKLLEPERIAEEEYRAFGLAYFHQGVACPFLEDESCSIHSERPLVCREYLVVSPAENCERRGAGPVKVLRVPASVSTAVRCFDGEGSRQREGWVPLILALEWADAHPDEPLERPGTELLGELFRNLTGQGIPPPPT
jgi:Fe-S-cluster containining protein